ncbi:MAG: class A beta-lactamase-related serine hydrolase [Omnitrophica bacterium]|nr:class A beta-lactamase-related serine hydrolase [Candidatus Omnitrophota bacterium]
MNSIQKRNSFIALVLIVCFAGLTLYSSVRLANIHRRIKLFNDLEKKINLEFANLDINLSFFIKDLKFPGLDISYRSQERFPGASLIKLPILAVVFEAVADKKISLDNKVIIKKRDIFGGSGELKSRELPCEVSIKELLKLMISASDNTATNKIVSILSFKYINAKFKELGLNNTILARRMMDFKKRRKGIENYISSYDIVLVLEKIYKKKLVNEELSNLALSFLTRQKVNDRIPLYLPKEVSVAHKTGLERGVVHDAGIVFTPKSDYIICVLVKDAKSYKQAKKIIAQVSLLTYNLYQ